MAKIKLLELHPAETPIEDLSYEATDNIFGGMCPNDNGDDRDDPEPSDGLRNFERFLISLGFDWNDPIRDFKRKFNF